MKVFSGFEGRKGYNGLVYLGYKKQDCVQRGANEFSNKNFTSMASKLLGYCYNAPCKVSRTFEIYFLFAF
jgi:hypothetical protein